MATDFAIRIRWDVSELAANKTMQIVRRVLQTMETETVVLTHIASYGAGTRVYNHDIAVGTNSSTDYGIGIDVDSTVSDARKNRMLKRITQALLGESFVVTTGVYSAGGSSNNQQILTVT